MLLKNKESILFMGLLFTTIALSYAQKDPIYLQGTVKNDSTYLNSINILNKTSGIGTYSNKNGKFTLTASLGDSILFSSLVYKNRIIKITNTHISSKAMTVYLNPDINELEEVSITKKFTLDLNTVSVDKRAVLINDDMSSKKAPNSLKFTDPTAKMVGISSTGIFRMLFKKSRIKRKKNRLEKEKIIYLKNAFPDNIKAIYGNDFFADWLNISEDQIYVFLDFCEGNGLKEYYNETEINIKNFLVKQSVQFNSLKK